MEIKNIQKKNKKSQVKILKFFNYPFEVCPNHFYLWSECEEDGEKFLMLSVCNKESCYVCGKKGSYSHYRRYKREIGFLYDLLKEYGAIGYLIITCPKEKREEWKNIKKLCEIRRYIIRLLKREIKNVAGIARWHWAGDKNKVFYPHLNILIGAGYLNKEKLKRIKKLIEKKENIKVVYYQYSKRKEKVRFWWRYISRPTFLLQNDVKYEEIKKIKNVVRFGKIKKNIKRMKKEEFKKFIEKIKEKFENENELWAFCVFNNRCPKCYNILRWKKFDKIVWDDLIKNKWGEKWKKIFKGVDFLKEIVYNINE